MSRVRYDTDLKLKNVVFCVYQGEYTSIDKSTESIDYQNNLPLMGIQKELIHENEHSRNVNIKKAFVYGEGNKVEIKGFNETKLDKIYYCKHQNSKTEARLTDLWLMALCLLDEQEKKLAQKYSCIENIIYLVTNRFEANRNVVERMKEIKESRFKDLSFKIVLVKSRSKSMGDLENYIKDIGEVKNHKDYIYKVL